MLLDKTGNYVKRQSCTSVENGKGILVTPTVHGNLILWTNGLLHLPDFVHMRTDAGGKVEDAKDLSTVQALNHQDLPVHRQSEKWWHRS